MSSPKIARDMNYTSPDLGEARRFLSALDPEAKFFTFQTFDDNEAKNPALSRILRVLEQEAAK